jgi:hypothetical protein
MALILKKANPFERMDGKAFHRFAAIPANTAGAHEANFIAQYTAGQLPNSGCRADRSLAADKKGGIR